MAQAEAKQADAASKIASVEIGKDAKGNAILMPKLGFGLYNIKNEDMERVVRNAIDCGYRHFDGASFYENEESFGKVISKLIKENVIKRSDLFITSKVWMDKMSYKDTIESAETSLKNLGKDIGYFDLFLVHWPRNILHIECYDAVLTLYYNNKTKGIGISNYLETDFKLLINGFGFKLNDEITVKNKNNFKNNERIIECKDNNLGNKYKPINGGNKFIMPMVNQLHINPFYYQSSIWSYIHLYAPNMVMQAYKPLERGDDKLLKNETILNLSKKYNCTAAQLCIQWGIQHGFVVLVKSGNKNRMLENMNGLLNLFNNKNKLISIEDLESIDELTTKETIENWMKRYVDRKHQYDKK